VLTRVALNICVAASRSDDEDDDDEEDFQSYYDLYDVNSRSKVRLRSVVMIHVV
jgi:hypothetical protein